MALLFYLRILALVGVHEYWVAQHRVEMKSLLSSRIGSLIYERL